MAMVTFNYMVEYSLQLNNIFGSLSDETRRDILRRVSKKALSVSEIAKHYKLTFAAISKHLQVLQKAKLIVKHREGKKQIIKASPNTLKDAADYLQRYEVIWNERFDRLDKLLQEEKN
jgi:DNA-binding transcriptional ArsR family regulator